MSRPRAENGSNVRRLRPARVLVAADDPRFLAVATIVLSRAGFVVSSTSRLDHVVSLVERDRPDAVLLDATNAVTAAARCAAAVERLRFAVQVLVVSDDPAARASFARFDKWDSFSEIVAEIERVSGGGGAGNDRSAER
jgi:PleD family two-component response regulator